MTKRNHVHNRWNVNDGTFTLETSGFHKLQLANRFECVIVYNIHANACSQQTRRVDIQSSFILNASNVWYLMFRCFEAGVVVGVLDD